MHRPLVKTLRQSCADGSGAMRRALFAGAALLVLGCSPVWAQTAPSTSTTQPAADGTAGAKPGYTPVNAQGQVEVVLKNHVFTPSEIRVPAGQRIQLLIKNQDPTADEFDSSALKVEKVIGGNTEGTVRLRALDPGTYPFMGEFHSDTAKGVVIAQ